MEVIFHVLASTLGETLRNVTLMTDDAPCYVNVCLRYIKDFYFFKYYIYL